MHTSFRHPDAVVSKGDKYDYNN